MLQWANELPRDAATTSSTQHKARPSHRHRSSRLHDSGSKRRTDARPATADSSPTNLKRKPPVAARPARLKANIESTQRRQACPPATLDIAPIHVDQQLSDTATSQPVEQVDTDQHQPPARTSSRTSASSDIESGSADSSTSGFSSAGSDVNKVTGISDEHATKTLGRQKPALKPKRTSYYTCLTH